MPGLIRYNRNLRVPTPESLMSNVAVASSSSCNVRSFPMFVRAIVSLSFSANARRYMRDGGGVRDVAPHTGGRSSAPSLGCRVGVARPWEVEARKASAPLRGLVEAFNASDAAEVVSTAKSGIEGANKIDLVKFRRKAAACMNAAGLTIVILDGAPVYRGTAAGACNVMSDMIAGKVPARI